MHKIKKGALPVFFTLAVTCFIGTAYAPNETIRLTFAHTGAVFVMGMFGAWVGLIADKRGRSYWIAFSMGFFIPILAGLVVELLFFGGRIVGCPGTICLLAGPLVALAYVLLGQGKDRRIRPARW